MTTPAAARRTVLFAMATAVGVSTVAEALDKDDELFQPRIILGGLFGAFFLLAISGRAPRVAAGFALLILVTAVTTAGPDVIDRTNPEALNLSRSNQTASPKQGARTFRADAPPPTTGEGPR